jgi:putative acetyltransferase
VSQARIEPALSATDEVRALIAELDRELARHYLPEQLHFLSLDAIFQPNVRFFVARLDAVAVGCGGVAFFPDFAEVKRMYVRDDARGHGVGRALLERIETEARVAGCSLLRLETGTGQDAAMALYVRCGFRNCPPFGDYLAMTPKAVAESVFLEKRL